MSEAPRSTASSITRCTSWITDASSPDAPKFIVRREVVERALRLGVAGVLLLLVDRLDLGRGAVAAPPVRVGEAADDELDVGGRGDRRADLVAGHDRDVVDGEHVGRVRHRDQQRAVAGEGDGHRVVALDRGGRDELGRVRVDAVGLQVEVVEAEALGDRARELVLGDRAGGEQDALRGRAGRGRHLDGLVHRLALDEPEIDDDVGQHAAGPTAPRGRGDAVALLGPGRCPGWCRWVHESCAISATAARMASRDAVVPVQRSNDAAPCAIRISIPVTTVAPRRLASARRAVPPGL